MLGKRAMVLVGSALLIGFAGLTARVPMAGAERSDGPEEVETQITTDSNPQLECYVSGGQWSSYTNECVMEAP
jgi:hypothetical protein